MFVKENFSQLGSRLKYFRKLKGYTNYERFAYEINISIIIVKALARFFTAVKNLKNDWNEPENSILSKGMGVPDHLLLEKFRHDNIAALRCNSLMF